MLPVNYVGTDRVAPAHVPPLVTERIVLVEEMIFALILDQSVRVVHPALFRGEMKLRPEWLRVIARWIDGHGIWRHREIKHYHSEQLSATGQFFCQFNCDFISHCLAKFRLFGLQLI